MGLYKCGGGSGGMSETVLWTNSNPSASFSSNINLSDNMSNYDFIDITFNASSSSSTINGRIRISTEEFLKLKGNGYCRAAIAMVTSTYRYTRLIGYNSDTQIGVTSCHRTTDTACSVTNGYVIPTAVYGIK